MSIAAAAGAQPKLTQKALNEKFDGLKTVLKNIKSPKGQDLYAHLQVVFKKLILHYPDQALEKLEEVSFLLKNADSYKIEKFLRLTDDRKYGDVCNQMRDYIALMKDQFGGKKQTGEDGEEAEAAEVPPVGLVPDLLEESEVYQWAGIGFGQQETYRLMLSMKKLSGEAGVAKLRFFGKIRGTQQDYYIVEGEAEGGEEEGGAEEEKPADFEDKGTGVNKMTYWVSHSSFGKWTKLPDLSPQDIQASRSIKVLFTGDLERTIFTNPFFFKSEKFYLRAQIARIAHSTTLCPKGLFRLQEDSTREIEDNAPEEGEIVLPTTNQMATADMWCHHSVGILQKNCRTTHKEQEPPEGLEIEPEEYMKQIEAQDPYEPRLKAISEDSKVIISKNQKLSPWIVSMKGDDTEYKTDAGKTTSNAVVVVRSLQWPGAFNFYVKGRYFNVYVGDGQKYEETSFFPVHPPKVLEDPEEYNVMPEPNPSDEQIAAQKKKEEEEAKAAEEAAAAE